MSAPDSLLARPWSKWPDWRCHYPADNPLGVCNLPATWQRKPSQPGAAAWTYCDAHRPADAEQLPAGAPYYVTRLELRIALAGNPGNRSTARDDAVRRAVYALEEIGALLVGLRVVGGKAERMAATEPPLRLQLAGRPEPLPGVRPLVLGPYDLPQARAWRKKRAG